MEYYLSKIASKDLYLDDVKMKVMARGENWKELSNFLKEKEKSGTPLGDFSQLTCRKKIKKLRSAIRHLSAILNKFGGITKIYAEHQLAVDGPIQIGETVEIRGGEIDAIFLLDNGQGKNNIVCYRLEEESFEQKSLEQYKRQCQAYVRSIENCPNLVGLTSKQLLMSDIRALLVEVGGNEQNDIEILEVELDDVDIDQFLIQAAQKYDSQEATPGNHCSSFCNWAFARDQCNQIGQDDLAIDFHNDHFGVV